MTNVRRWLLALLCASCGEVTSAADVDATAAPDAANHDGSPSDAALSCRGTDPFLAPVAVGGFSAGPEIVRLAGDELTAVFQVWNDGYDLYMAKRAAVDLPFGQQAVLTSVNSHSQDSDADLSGDGLRLFFASARVSGESLRIYVATRETTSASFGLPTKVVDLAASSATANDTHPYLRSDGSELWFTSSRSGGLGGNDVYRAVATSGGFLPPQLVPGLSSADDEVLPVISSDGLTVYFSSTRPGGGGGGLDLWRAHRGSTAVAFDPPIPMTEFNTAGRDLATWLSPDGCRLYLDSAGRVSVAVRLPR